MEKIKILVIDDEKILVKSTCMALSHYGFNIIGETDPKAAVKVAESFKPDIILLDIMMPELNGWQVLGLLKENEPTTAIPVVIFTAREDGNDKFKADELGAAGLLTKPFDINILVSYMENVLGIDNGARD